MTKNIDLIFNIKTQRICSYQIVYARLTIEVKHRILFLTNAISSRIYKDCYEVKKKTIFDFTNRKADNGKFERIGSADFQGQQRSSDVPSFLFALFVKYYIFQMF